MCVSNVHVLMWMLRGPLGQERGFRRLPLELEEHFLSGGGGCGGGGGGGEGGTFFSKEQSKTSLEESPVAVVTGSIAANFRRGSAEEADVPIILFLLRAEEGERFIMAEVGGLVPPSPG